MRMRVAIKGLYKATTIGSKKSLWRRGVYHDARPTPGKLPSSASSLKRCCAPIPIHVTMSAEFVLVNPAERDPQERVRARTRQRPNSLAMRPPPRPVSLHRFTTMLGIVCTTILSVCVWNKGSRGTKGGRRLTLVGMALSLCMAAARVRKSSWALSRMYLYAFLSSSLSTAR